MSLANRAAAITPPVVGHNIWGLDADDVTPAVWFTIPESWYGAILELEADGEDFYFAIGNAITTVSASAKSTYSSNEITAIGSVAGKVKSGGVKSIDLSVVDKKHKLRMAVVGADGTAGNILRITRASGFVNKASSDLVSP